MTVDSKLAVRMSPLHFAVKVKAPKCVEVLLEFGADIKMKLKTTENKSLPITALQLAEGEREMAAKNNRQSDIEVYDDIVSLINEHEKNKKTKKKKKVTPAEVEPVKSIDTKAVEENKEIDTTDVPITPNSTPISPTSAVDMHRLTLKVAQQQSAIKKLEDKNVDMQKEIETLRQDLDLLKKLMMSMDLSQPRAAPAAAAPTAQEKKEKRKTMLVKKSEEPPGADAPQDKKEKKENNDGQSGKWQEYSREGQ